MVLSIRSGSGAPSKSPAQRRAPRGADALVLRVMAGFAALAAALFFAIPVQADEIEPEPEPAPQAEPEPAPEPEPEPAPAPIPHVVSEEEAFSEPSWIPSIETGFETFDYNTDTAVLNHINPPAFQAVQSEAERQLMFRIGGELMGPMFDDLPGRPRLFVKGGAQIRTWSSDKIFLIRDPFIETEPERSVNAYYRDGSKALTLPDQFFGQGSEITGRIQDPSWYAGVGVAFSVPVATNLLFYIKPSIQYSMEKVDFSAGLTTVEETSPPGTVDPDVCGTRINIPCNRTFEIHRSLADGSTTDHSVGAGLEVAMVPFRKTRPIRVALYAEARFLWLLSDDTTEFSDSAGIATYSVVRDDFNIQGGGGFRFSWVGFD